jgi:hypothetical protein
MNSRVNSPGSRLLAASGGGTLADGGMLAGGMLGGG